MPASTRPRTTDGSDQRARGWIDRLTPFTGFTRFSYLLNVCRPFLGWGPCILGASEITNAESRESCEPLPLLPSPDILFEP